MIIIKRNELKKRMAVLGFDGKAFSQSTGISQSHLSCLLAGKHNTTPPKARKICEILKCSFDDIFIWEETQNVNSI